MNERDTKFLGFARLLVQELLGLRYQTVYYNDPQMLETYERIISQRAYDLVRHTIYNIDPYHLDALDYDEIPTRIPDLTSWPELKPE